MSMFRVPGAAYDLASFDYTLALENEQVIVSKQAKQHIPQKLDETIRALASIISNLERRGSGFADYSREQMRFFVGGLEKQVRISIWRRHTWSGWFFIILETIFWYGRLHALKKIEYRISTMRAKSAPAVSLVMGQIFAQNVPKPYRVEETPILLPQIQIRPVIWRSFTRPGERAEIRPEWMDPSFYVYDPLFLSLLGITSSRSLDIETRLRELLKQDLNFLWLASLLKQKLSSDAVRCIVNVLGSASRITRRYEQIRSVEIEREDPAGQLQKMTPIEMLYEAFFIEERIFKIDRVANTIFLARGPEKLARALQYDARSHDVFLLSEPAISTLSRQGQYKQISLAMRLARNDVASTPEIAVRAFNRILEPIDLHQIEDDLKSYRQEITFIRLLQDVEGCIKLYTEASYYETISGVPCPRLSMILQRGVKDLQDVIESGARLPLRRQIELASGMLRFFARMHEEKHVIHGDIKADNILLNEKGEVIVIDYGVAFSEDMAHPKKTRPSAMFGQGSYGTMKFSGPDLFSRYNFHGNFRATDCFAFGCVLFHLYFNTCSPGSERLDRYADLVEANRDALERQTATAAVRQMLKESRKQACQELSAQIDRQIEAPFRKLAAKSSLTDEEKYQKVIYGLMRKDPVDRLSMRQALTQLGQISATG
jgi:serine/threonine protein kinase